MHDVNKFDPARYKFWTDDHVRFSDLDPLGHVNNNAIGQYFENARALLFQDLTPEWPQGDQIFVLAHIAIDFRAELHMPAQLRIGTLVTRVGRTSASGEYAVFEETKGGLRGIATCESVSVLIDMRTRKPAIIPENLRTAVKKYMAD